MKKVFYASISVSLRKRIPSIVLCFGLCVSAAKAQSFYFSGFDDPTGKYSAGKPGCSLGVTALAVPDIVDASKVSNNNLSDYASLTTTPLALGALCTDSFRIIADLNLGGLTAIPASTTNSYNAGFKISVSETVRASLLSGSSGLAIVTYEGAVEKQRSAVGAVAIGLLQANVPSNVSFLATEPFNRVGVVISSGLLNVASGSSVNFYYGFAVTDLVILPVKLTGFSATAENKAVAINWASALETNLAHYELQRSSDGGTTFTNLTTVKAKGNTAGETRYSFTDGTVLNGSYTYRLKMTDKDGGTEYSKLVVVKLATGADWKIYPTLLSSGTDLNIGLAATSGKTGVQLTNLQGQVVRTSSATNSKLTIATGNLPAGIYVLKLYKDGQLQATEKVVIQ